MDYEEIYGTYHSNHHLRKLRGFFPGEKGNRYVPDPPYLEVPNNGDMWNSLKYDGKGNAWQMNRLGEFCKAMSETHGALFHTIDTVFVRYTQGNVLYLQFQLVNSGSFRTLMIYTGKDHYRIHVDNKLKKFKRFDEYEPAATYLLGQEVECEIVDTRCSHLNSMVDVVSQNELFISPNI